MVQFNAILNTLSKNISSKPGKKSKLSVARKAANDLAKEAKRNELLLTSCGSVNDRNQKNFSSCYSKRGKKGLNQDSYIVWEEFGCQEDMVFCGVFDGHGPWGHFVAKTVRDLMPSLLLCNWQETVALNAENQDYNLGQDTKHSQFDIWKQSCYKTCADVDQELLRHSGIDSFYSGSTTLALVRQGDLMIIANVGDSRAVLATVSDDGSYVATQLTVDHKPNLPHESKRIAQSRGKVYCCPDEPGVPRVWIPNGETVEGPGLAVSRAFGDHYIKNFGLISEPEITHRRISSRDQFAILATDGGATCAWGKTGNLSLKKAFPITFQVWDVISNQEAVEIAASTAQRAESSKTLVEYAVSAWKQRGKSAVMDDISAVCLFFHDSVAADQEVYDMKMNQKNV